MEYKINTHYPITELENISEWWKTHREYDINEHIEPRQYDENGNLLLRTYNDYIEIVPRDEELVKDDTICALKSELAKIKEDIEQEMFGLVRDDFTEKKARAAEIVNELRVLEGKEPRAINI